MTRTGSNAARRVALVTHRATADLTTDDQLVVPPLAARGIEATSVRWDDETVEWREFDAVIIRSCWDYHLRAPEFRRWLDRLDAVGATVCNATDVLRWNMDKRYLRELSERGVPIVPTRWVSRGADETLASILHETDWRSIVLKPTISASAHETWRLEAGEHARSTAGDEERFRTMVSRGDVMVQPFMDAVERDGEWSLIFFAGEYSHAVLKRPRRGDFRVQSEHGGFAEARVPSDRIVGQARGALHAVVPRTLYARVDGCAVDDLFVLMELELLEPSLFLELDAAAAGRFAAAIEGVVAEAEERGAAREGSGR
jgi:glutathione synthase/RimK-type ligase-like ATP-grasp enzyme